MSSWEGELAFSSATRSSRVPTRGMMQQRPLGRSRHRVRIWSSVNILSALAGALEFGEDLVWCAPRATGYLLSTLIPRRSTIEDPEMESIE